MDEARGLDTGTPAGGGDFEAPGRPATGQPEASLSRTTAGFPVIKPSRVPDSAVGRAPKTTAQLGGFALSDTIEGTANSLAIGLDRDGLKIWGKLQMPGGATPTFLL